MFSNLVRRFHRNEEASGNIEYAVMIGAGILFIAFAANSMTSSVNESLDKAGEKIQHAMRGSDGVAEKESATYTSSKHNRRPSR